MGERIGGVAVLVGHVVRGIVRSHVEGHRDGAVRSLITRRVDNLRPIHLQQLGALRRDVVRHHNLQRVALACADHRQRYSGVAGCRLENRLTWSDQALLFGVLDQGLCDPILDRTGWIVALELGPDSHARLRREPLELNQRRIADRVDEIAVAAGAGTAFNRWNSHALQTIARRRAYRERLAPPAIAGRITSPSAPDTTVSRPSSTRTSSSFR
uniref:Unannotated protein n=1 Tax=freshwater metagenome TaxID=449393 RepID=A0A6J5ZL32_9ZZZZ